ncbi:hypothetical protein [Rheinheimera sp. UJ63]|uniref:hypothetical protein n=1 Tax=Rheinheimera sp. UJ63 TaxID=2910157 RepID=UPI001F3E9BC0|nr:hypothetical protein [Rheinheimera sp. UJ63]MCF4010596.1 hypothetical protein [Rheinheimera sp. UJ63]
MLSWSFATRKTVVLPEIPNFPALFFSHLKTNHSAALQNSLKQADVSLSYANSIVFHSFKFDPDKCNELFLKLRPHFPANDWNEALCVSLIEGLERLKIHPMAVQAVRAT